MSYLYIKNGFINEKIKYMDIYSYINMILKFYEIIEIW